MRETNKRRLDRAGKISWSYTRKAFVLRGRLISGLLPRLQASLYPDYDWSHALRDAPAQTRLRDSTASTPASQHTRGASRFLSRDQLAQFRGKANGTKLDTQLHKAIALLRRLQLSPCDFVCSTPSPKTPSERLASHTQSEDLSSQRQLQLQAMRACMSEPALRFFAMCVVKGYSPLYSQATVGCTAARVATNIDVVCTNAAGERVLIENKIGFSTYYNSACGTLRSPFTQHPNSPKSHHQLQLALTKSLHEKTFPSIPVKRENCFVWRYDGDGVTEYVLEHWADAGALNVLKSLERR